MSSLTARRRSYVAVQVTLSSGANRLLDLVNAVIAAESNMPVPPMVCPDACGHLVIQNDEAATDGDPLFIGDSLISSSRYGYSLAGEESKNYHSPMNNIAFGQIYALGNGQKVNVEVMTF